MKFYKVAHYEPYEGDFDVVYFRELSSAEEHRNNMIVNDRNSNYYVQEVQTED